MNTIIVNKEQCIGCKICFKACFIDVIKWDEAQRGLSSNIRKNVCSVCSVN